MVASASDFTSDADAPWDDLIDFFTECLIFPPIFKGFELSPFHLLSFVGQNSIVCNATVLKLAVATNSAYNWQLSIFSLNR